VSVRIKEESMGFFSGPLAKWIRSRPTTLAAIALRLIVVYSWVDLDRRQDTRGTDELIVGLNVLILVDCFTEAEKRGKTEKKTTACLILYLERTVLLSNFGEWTLDIARDSIGRVKKCCYMSLKYSGMDVAMAMASWRFWILADEVNVWQDNGRKMVLLFENCCVHSVTNSLRSQHSLWGIFGDHRVYVRFLETKFPVRIKDESYENQRWNSIDCFCYILLPTDRANFFLLQMAFRAEI